MNSHPAPQQALREELCRVGASLHARGYVHASAGNLSARLTSAQGGGFLIINDDYGLDELGRAHPQHYAFLVGETEFDVIFGRIQRRGLTFWADPGRSRPGEINTNDGGRGCYWEEPSGHLLEIITRPYGG